jgi:hypothetical protein
LLEEDHLIATHLDFTNGKHLIQWYLCHHGTNWLQFYLNQPVCYHIKCSNIPHMWRILVLMLTLKFSRKWSEPMVRSWK